jgi:shikimate kinase
MGSGKSTVGRALAASLGCRYIDNDVTVHALAGRPPVDLAAAGGTLLHDWESRYVWRVSELSPPLAAGIPASAADRPADLALLAGTGRLIYLRCDVPTLVRRVSADPPRPWLRATDVPGTVEAMFARRDEKLRRAAWLTVDATGPVAQTVRQIVSALRASASVADPSARSALDRPDPSHLAQGTGSKRPRQLRPP